MNKPPDKKAKKKRKNKMKERVLKLSEHLVKSIIERIGVENIAVNLRVDYMVENLRIDNATIANLAVNSRQMIGTINQQIQGLEANASSKDLAKALASITEAAAKTSEKTDDERQEILESVEALADAAAKPPTERKKGVVKAVLSSLASGCGAAGGLATVWQVAEPAIRAYFGI